MALPADTASILSFLGHVIDDDFVVGARAGVVTLEWLAATTEPTEAEIITAGADGTSVGGQVFSEWFDEHGGDDTLTRRRKAREAVDALKADSVQFRAALLEIVDEFNRHTTRINGIMDAIDGASNLGQVKTAVGALADIPDRTGQDLRDAVIARLNTADADT